MAENNCPLCGTTKQGPSRDDLLAEYRDKPVTRMAQIDGFTNLSGEDCVLGGDVDGDSIMLGETHELMRSPSKNMPVRILIHEDADPEAVKRLLRKALSSVDHALDFMDRVNDPISLELPY